MAQAYLLCEDCGGSGYVTCSHCDCPRCHSVGELRCSHCQGGLVDCLECGGTGKIPAEERYLFFFKRPSTQECPSCFHGRVRCSVCEGSSRMPCPECISADGSVNCTYCEGSRRMVCPGCNGARQVVSEWTTNLKMLATDDLRFEHEKLRAKRANLEIKLSRLHVDRDAEQRETDYWSERIRIEGGGFDWKGAAERSDKCDNAVASCRREIEQVEEAMLLVEAQLSRRSSVS